MKTIRFSLLALATTLALTSFAGPGVDYFQRRAATRAEKPAATETQIAPKANDSCKRMVVQHQGKFLRTVNCDEVRDTVACKMHCGN